MQGAWVGDWLIFGEVIGAKSAGGHLPRMVPYSVDDFVKVPISLPADKVVIQISICWKRAFKRSLTTKNCRFSTCRGDPEVDLLEASL